MSITPKNWDSFQHYKNRAPAWIKLHRGLLDDFAYSRLPLASRALAPLLWLLASEYEGGKITATNEEIAFRFRMTVDELSEGLNPLLEAKFFLSDSKPLARRKRSACLEVEGEKQVEIEEEKTIGRSPSATRPERSSDFEEFWKVYPKREGANPKAPSLKKFTAAVRSGADPASIIASARRYAIECRDQKKFGTPYVAQAMTWLGQQRFDDYRPPPTGGPLQAPAGAPSDDELRKKYGQERLAVSPQAEAPNINGAGADHAGELQRHGGEIRPILWPF